MKFHSGDIEIAIAEHLNFRQHLLVPNVSWGLGFNHEIDLLVVTRKNYAWEIEIKISKSDLKADKKKKHEHKSKKIARLYFAVPYNLKDDALQLIPEHAGLFVVRNYNECLDHGRFRYPEVQLVKAPKINTDARPLTDWEMTHLYHLAAMRIWSLKRVVYRLLREKHEKENKDSEKS